MPTSSASETGASDAADIHDVIVVGGGSAGAVLAARLAENGVRVLVLEAGPDPLEVKSQEGQRSMEADYRVPAFHAFASENPGLKHDLWVRHYCDDARQERDPKYDADRDGVLYPRARGLGGCSGHHALIVVKPNDRDWNHIAEANGDPSWSAPLMHRYWERIERCRHRWAPWRWLAALTGWNPTGHGWNGWMQTEWTFPLSVFRDRPLRSRILSSMGAAADVFPDRAFEWQTTNFDPNARRIWKGQSGGARLLPMSTRGHARCGSRERLRDVEARHGDCLAVRLNAEVTRIVVEAGRATEVAYRHDGKEHRARARREIVLSAGTFLSPQLLMLSGIGDPAELARHGIAPLVDLPGVGRNMQDRYEIGVVTRMKKPWAALKGVTYSTIDRNYRLWKRFRLGNFKSNGVLFAAALKSRPNLPIPDLLCFALLADFRGYAPDYSRRLLAHDYLSWVVLKAYTSNNAGTVALRSADIADPPRVDFRYFDEGSPGGDEDLDAVVTGIRFVRKIADSMGDLVAMEEEPGRHRLTYDSLRDYVRDNAWGHHACGTCAMLPRDRGGVVDSRFRVHGVEGLRVVDASVFPRIPGYFPVSAVYMIAEKAADTMLADREAVPSYAVPESSRAAGRALQAG